MGQPNTNDEWISEVHEHKGPESGQCLHVIFAILKFGAVQHIEEHGWESIESRFNQNGVDIIWHSPLTIRFTGEYWTRHYDLTIAEKEAQRPGDGERYREKIIRRLGNTDGIPILVCIRDAERGRHAVVNYDELKSLKENVRQEMQELIPEHANVEKQQLLHMADDCSHALEELHVLQEYLKSDPACRGMSTGTADVRDIIRMDILPKLRASEEFIRGCGSNDSPGSCIHLRKLLQEDRLSTSSARDEEPPAHHDEA